MSYYFVVFGSAADYYLDSYSDLKDCSYGVYILQPVIEKNSVINCLYRLHTSFMTNKHVNIPGKSLWYRKTVEYIPDEGQKCFVFFSTSIRPGLITYLKKRYPASKFVCFYQDLIDSIKKRAISLDDVKKEFNLILSFDPADCKKYDLIYYPLVYSKPKRPSNENDIINDVYFVGLAKNRLKGILDTFSYLHDAGLKCDFHIVGVDYKDQKYRDEIDYCGVMDYSTNIENILKAKSLLEIMQTNGTGFTLRACEAIAYDKMLITNNPEVTNAPFYDSGKVLHFDRCDEIDTFKIKESDAPFDYNFKDELSPIKLLKFINKRL